MLQKLFRENVIAIAMKKTEVLMNKPNHLGLSLLELSKILLYEISFDYVKSKLCSVDTDSFVLCIKTDAIYKDIKDINSNYELDCSNGKWGVVGISSSQKRGYLGQPRA